MCCMFVGQAENQGGQMKIYVSCAYLCRNVCPGRCHNFSRPPRRFFFCAFPLTFLFVFSFSVLSFFFFIRLCCFGFVKYASFSVAATFCVRCAKMRKSRRAPMVELLPRLLPPFYFPFHLGVGHAVQTSPLQQQQQRAK